MKLFIMLHKLFIYLRPDYLGELKVYGAKIMTKTDKTPVNAFFERLQDRLICISVVTVCSGVAQRSIH